MWCGSGTGRGEAVNVEVGRDILESAFEALDVGIELADVILQAFNPALLLGNALATLFLMTVNKLHEVISQSFILHVAGVGEGRMDDANDSQGERSCMYRWPCGLIWYSWGVKKVWGSLDKVCFSGDGEEGGHMLLLSAVASFLSNSEKLGIADAVFICGVDCQGTLQLLRYHNHSVQ